MPELTVFRTIMLDVLMDADKWAVVGMFILSLSMLIYTVAVLL